LTLAGELTRTASKIMRWKEALLDGSRTNQLLYFKGSEAVRGANAVRLYGNEDALFARLLKEQRQPEPIAPHMLGLDPIDPDSSPDDVREQQERSDRITRRIKRLRERARDAQNNQGINILFAACGILEWQETETSEETIHSPLILIPIDLKSAGSWTDEYSIERISESRVVLNPTLYEKLKHDFGIQLPALPDDGRAPSQKTMVSLTEILDLVRESFTHVHAAQNWSVLKEIYLGLFTFQRQALYDDLTINFDLAMGHSIIQAICGEGAFPRPADPIIPAEDLDTHIPIEETWQVLDADASQQEAIVAAKHGQSFVLQGPPGTGKSQTIANIIAECLACGKKILFVSEKMAAIEVVQKRLADVGLDPFCLNLHQRGTGRGEKERVFSVLKSALSPSPSTSTYHEHLWRDASIQVGRTRQQLNEYVRELHQRRSPLFLSAFDVYGRIAEHFETPDVSCTVPDPANMTPYQLQSLKEALEELSNYCELLVNARSHPWKETLLREFTPSIQANIHATYSDLAKYWLS
jgi:hypothetical protein